MGVVVTVARRDVVTDDEVRDASILGRLDCFAETLFEVETVRDDEVCTIEQLDVLCRWLEVMWILAE